VLDGRTWRWFTVRLFNLPPESATWRAMRAVLDRRRASSTGEVTSKDDVRAAIGR
jgi:hypothetical protein